MRTPLLPITLQLHVQVYGYNPSKNLRQRLHCIVPVSGSLLLLQYYILECRFDAPTTF